MPTKLKINSLLIIIAVLVAGGCTTIYNPATQRRETLLIDTKNEVALGRDMDAGLQKQLKILDSPKLQQRLDSIGSRVTRFSDRQDLDYHFRVVNDKELNAFAIPGGFIYVNSGLMDTATDDELASVLGHEIGHVAARHSVKKMQTVLGYQIIMSIALQGTDNPQIGQATDIVFNIINLGYSRKDEFLADKLGVHYAKRAGFNPYGMVTFFGKLKQEARKKGANFNLVFLSSHPPIEERIKNAEKEIALNN